MLSLMYLKLGRTESEFPFDYKGSGTEGRPAPVTKQSPHNRALCGAVYGSACTTHEHARGHAWQPAWASTCPAMLSAHNSYTIDIPSLLTREFDFDVNRGWSLKQ